jgi:serine/threonine-protein kinase
MPGSEPGFVREAVMEAVTQGTLIADRYRAIREIGFGGMGTVWLAYDEALDSQCALKLIGADQAPQEEFRLRFECEAKCAAQLRSAHVVDVLNCGQWQGAPFIVMEYLEGEDLEARLERAGRLELRTTYRIIAQVARALMRAHMLGIVHRDIKPGNIFLVPGDEHEIAKVLDFGVAKHRALPNAYENLASGVFIGTPCYMSPEQASGGAVDWRSDLWSLAVIVFECLTGVLPFDEEAVAGTILAITRGPIPSLTANRPELPPELEDWWQRATARDPADRFQSAKEFADAFADAIGFSSKLAIPDFTRASAEPHSNSGLNASPAYETDAAVTLHPPSRSRSGRLGTSRPRRREFPFYTVAVTALCSALVVSAVAWRPELEARIGSLGLEATAHSVITEHAEFSEARARRAVVESARVTSLDSALASDMNAGRVRSAEPEPTVLVVEPPAPSAPPTHQASKKAAVAPRVKQSQWQAPVEEPVPAKTEQETSEAYEEAHRGIKDYGI